MGSTTSETASDATEEVHSCANCRKDADDKQPCTGCLNAPAYTGGIIETTWFCSPQCQVQNETVHKDTCTAADCRRTLYRAGHTVQLIFKCCLEALSKISIAKVEKKGKAMYVHEASDIDEQAIPSLSSVFDSEDDKEAAIACMASSAAVPFVRGLLEHMLPDLLLQFARVDHTVKDPRRRVIMILPDRTEIDNASQPHSILQITLKNFESFAIDITGVQYGYHDSVIPWDIYRKSRIQEVRRVRPLRRLADDQRQIDDDGFSESSGVYHFVALFLETVKDWEANNLPMQYILKGGRTWGR